MRYLFDPADLLAASRLGVGLPFDAMCQAVTAELVRRYPGHVDPAPRWVFNLAGGTTGSMGILHASLTEYVLLFGTPIGTEGYSGRFLLEIHDFVMAGEMWTVHENNFGERVITRPGEGAVLPRGTTKGFCVQPGTWMLEYARGPVPTSLPMGLGDALLSGQDPWTVLKTMYGYGRLVTRELLKGKV